ncbi:hypothetical protein [Spongiivirga citrea]|uniref:DUF2268 domain-containing protein n=1 Tax=Spongiivirga citrea TaxID=1481457 RepID=A0A6M0CGJ2_9FLAO|nr:hypothetical protein [Spongiivirga citrea]NER16602.1 hypothetical protein [Spongiivirga citrea]
MRIFKNVFIALLLANLFYTFSCNSQDYSQEFITEDIANFWEVYDTIVAIKDSVERKKIIQKRYIDKSTEGLKLLMDARRYSADEYIAAINNYPKFWESIRTNTTNLEQHFKKINGDIEKLKQLYPDLKPSPIYFSFGVFRSNGTIKNGNVLIGAEMALLSKDIDVSELPKHIQEFHRLQNPIEDLPLLCTHEYVHTQQKEMEYYLLNNCLYEGIAEFIATTATGKQSYLNAIQFAQLNYEEVRNRFEEDLYKTYFTNWLWSSGKIMGERDLGYGVGYAIAKRNYDQASDKKKAIKEMIELEFTDEDKIISFVDKSGYLSKPLNQLHKDYENYRPKVTNITGLENGSESVSAGRLQLTLHFSEGLDGKNQGLDYGSEGEKTLPKIVGERVWSNENTSWSITMDLESGKHYQLYVTDGFINDKGVQLKPYLIEFWTE